MLATIPSPANNVLELGPLTIHYYGVAIAVGAIMAVLLARRRWGALGGDPDVIDRIAFWAVLAGLVGARLAYVAGRLFRSLDGGPRAEFIDRPWTILFVWEGGLAFFGGILFGAVVGLWMARRNGLHLPAFMDAAIPGVPLAQAFGRWGNYFNQELYGTPTDLPWGLEIDREPSPVHPTFLYESIYNLILIAVLIRIGRARRLKEGSLLFCYMVGYGVGRFLLEQIRTDTPDRYLGLSVNAWVALLVAGTGAALLVRWQGRDTDRPTDEPLPQPVPATGEAAAGEPAPGEPAAVEEDESVTEGQPTDDPA
jgi:prolipoprotein diacylglyceryl transferase